MVMISLNVTNRFSPVSSRLWLLVVTVVVTEPFSRYKLDKYIKDKLNQMIDTIEDQIDEGHICHSLAVQLI